MGVDKRFCHQVAGCIHFIGSSATDPGFNGGYLSVPDGNVNFFVAA
jgi:hypothetical protein